MLDGQVAPPADETAPDAGELPPSGAGDGDPSSLGAPTLPDAQELRNRLAAMGREKQMADARANQLERQVSAISQTIAQQQAANYQAAEQAELEQIARLPVHEQALRRAERAERKLTEFQQYEMGKQQAADQDAYMRNEATRLLNLANDSYGLRGTEHEIRFDQLNQQAWSNRDAYIAALAGIGQERQEKVVSKQKAKGAPAADQSVEERIKAGVDAALSELGVSRGGSPKPLGGKNTEGAIDAIAMAHRNNARFKTDGPQATLNRLKEAREALAAKAR